MVCEECNKDNHKDCIKPVIIDADSNAVDYECCCGQEQWVYNIGSIQPKCDIECWLFKCRTCLLENEGGICRRQFKPLNPIDDAGDVVHEV